MHLYLTPREREIFAGLPQAARAGWTPVDETLTYADTAASQQERARLMKITSPKLRRLQQQAAAARSEKEVQTLLSGLTGIAMTADELLDICFVLGPLPMGDLIERMLREATDERSVGDAAAFTELRHSVLSVLQTVTPLP